MAQAEHIKARFERILTHTGRRRADVLRLAGWTPQAWNGAVAYGIQTIKVARRTALLLGVPDHLGLLTTPQATCEQPLPDWDWLGALERHPRAIDKNLSVTLAELRELDRGKS